VTLTERLAAVGFSAGETTGPLGEVLAGFVDRRMPSRSTAVLARHNGLFRDSTFGEANPLAVPELPDELTVTGLPLPELYRIILAGTNRGGSQMFTLDDDALRSYRDPILPWGFPEMAERIAQHA
jgi:hypothetical protein